ncbi:hypothetical protein JEZ13_09270, partial [bacterium]|nr:hypothetical protein [bacterium]
MKQYSIGPAIFIGLGGTGRIALLELKKKLMQKGMIRSDVQNPLLKFLSIDTEFLSSNTLDGN